MKEGTHRFEFPHFAEAAWLLVCLLLPISGRLVPVPLAVAIVLCLVLAFRRFRGFGWWSWSPLFAYFALHVIGLAWSSDVSFGLFDVQVKAGLVLLPIAAWAIGRERPDVLRRSMLAFTGGMGLAMVLGVIKALECHALDGQANCFSQSTLSYQLHPSYAAWYGCWCLGYWGLALISGEVEARWLRWCLLVALPLILLFTTLLASKSGVIGLGIVLVVLVWAAVVRLRGPLRRLVLVFTGALVLAAIGTQGTLLRARMQIAVEALEQGLAGDRAILVSDEGSALRMVAWSCSIACIKEEPLGAGTGDIKHALMQCYTDKGAVEAAKRQLNSHSQFLQSGVALGWPGLLLLVAVAMAALVLARRTGSAPLALFMLLFVANAGVESVLEVQAGVLFFALFLGLLFHGRTSQAGNPGTGPHP